MSYHQLLCAGTLPDPLFSDLAGLLTTPSETLVCDIWYGAGQCNVGNAGFAGTLTLTMNSVTFNLAGTLTSGVFHVYMGACPVNDDGYFANNGSCPANVNQYKARVPGKYTLVGEPNPPVNTFEYNSGMNLTPFLGNNWPSTYAAFPIGATGHRYLSAHVAVTGTVPCPP